MGGGKWGEGRRSGVWPGLGGVNQGGGRRLLSVAARGKEVGGGERVSRWGKNREKTKEEWKEEGEWWWR